MKLDRYPAVKRLLGNLFPYYLLGLVVMAIALINRAPGTWLTGWDNLHPEFNALLNIKRSLFAVWQEYQGLGLLGGMGHAADLPRQLLIGILSQVFPLHEIRYLLTVSMLYAGAVGVYVFLKSQLKEETIINKIIATGGALFYLLNLATVQIFYVPFEAFVVHYGALPWLVYLAISYLQNPQRKKLMVFFLLSVLTTTQAYVPTLFVVYICTLILIVLGGAIENRSLKFLQRGLVLFLVTLAANAIWLPQFIYFTATSSNVVGGAQENFMATEDIYLRNKEFGDLANVAILRGFWFKFVDFHPNNESFYMVEAWRNHLSQPLVLLVSYAFFGIVILGIFSVLRKKPPLFLGFVAVFLFAFLNLGNDIPVAREIVALFHRLIPLYQQAFRVPFTKFAVLAAFIYSVFFAHGLSAIFTYIKRLHRHAQVLVGIVVFCLLMLVNLPTFTGNFFYSYAQLDIPAEYFSLMNFFKNQPPMGRIANFPQPSYWGWNHFLWGYRGSGLLWYGIEQPIVDRAFDGYSRQSENYYWELAYAVSSQNVNLLQNVLAKYQIEWVVIDNNLIYPSSPKAIDREKLVELISNVPGIREEARFGRLIVYHIQQPEKSSFVSLRSNLPRIAPSYRWNNFDQAYVDLGNYISYPTNSQQLTTNDYYYYPFRSLFTGRRQEELEFTIEADDKNFYLSSQLPKELTGSKLILPKPGSPSMVEVAEEDVSRQYPKFVQVFLDGELIPYSLENDTIVDLPYIKEGNLVIMIPKIKGYFSYDSEKMGFADPAKSCDRFNTGTFARNTLQENGYTFNRLTSTGSSNCLDINLPELSHEYAYLVTIDHRNISGKSLMLSVVNKNSERAELETYLPKSSKSLLDSIFSSTKSLPMTTSYFVIPQMEPFAYGYLLHIDNKSVGREKTVNDLGRITVNSIPYRYLAEIKVVMNNESRIMNNGERESGSLTVSHPNPSLYQITDNSREITENDTLVLSQAFDSGWRAYRIKNNESRIINFISQILPFFVGEELKDHVLVNNWSNGWNLNTLTINDPARHARPLAGVAGGQRPATIIIVYLPQYLEYLGFVLLVGVFGYLGFKRKN